MREILFRGKDPETGCWYEGFYMSISETTYCFKEDYDRHPDNTKHYIIFDRMTDWCLPNQHLLADIDPSTVGQYTGLKDRNGKRIFEGDIVEGADYTAEDGGYGVVSFDDGAFEVSGNNCSGTFHENYWGSEFEVIGNIHDNPEMLKGGEG